MSNTNSPELRDSQGRTQSDRAHEYHVERKAYQARTGLKFGVRLDGRMHEFLDQWQAETFHLSNVLRGAEIFIKDKTSHYTPWKPEHGG